MPWSKTNRHILDLASFEVQRLAVTSGYTFPSRMAFRREMVDVYIV